jgi:hypothetical protein
MIIDKFFDKWFKFCCFIGWHEPFSDQIFDEIDGRIHIIRIDRVCNDCGKIIETTTYRNV